MESNDQNVENNNPGKNFSTTEEKLDEVVSEVASGKLSGKNLDELEKKHALGSRHGNSSIPPDDDEK